MKVVIAVFGGIFVILLMGALGWVAAGNDLAMAAFFAPKYEQVRRTTFEQSKAYNDGMAQELRAMQFEYIKADDKHKAALASVIRHRAAGFPEQNLPSDLNQFIRSLP